MFLKYIRIYNVFHTCILVFVSHHKTHECIHIISFIPYISQAQMWVCTTTYHSDLWSLKSEIKWYAVGQKFTTFDLFLEWKNPKGNHSKSKLHNWETIFVFGTIAFFKTLHKTIPRVREPRLSDLMIY